MSSDRLLSFRLGGESLEDLEKFFAGDAPLAGVNVKVNSKESRETIHPPEFACITLFIRSDRFGNAIGNRNQRGRGGDGDGDGGHGGCGGGGVAHGERVARKRVLWQALSCIFRRKKDCAFLALCLTGVCQDIFVS